MIMAMKTIVKHILLLSILSVAAACSYREYAPSDYPSPQVYLPAALVSDAIWTIDGTPLPINYAGKDNKSFYDISEDGRKLEVHLGVVASGIERGHYLVKLSYAHSRINYLREDGSLPIDVLPLPEGACSLPESVVIDAPDVAAPFDLKISLSYLKDPEFIGKRFAVGVRIACEDAEVTEELENVIILIDPAFLHE